MHRALVFQVVYAIFVKSHSSLVHGLLKSTLYLYRFIPISFDLLLRSHLTSLHADFKLYPFNRHIKFQFS